MPCCVKDVFAWIVLSLIAVALSPHAALATASRYAVTDLGIYWDPDYLTIGTDLNNSDQVFGYQYSVYPIPFLYTPDEGVQPVNASGDPIAMNDQGQLLMGGLHGSGPFVYPNGAVTELPTLLSPIANDINNLGQVVGAVPIVDKPIRFTELAFHAHVYTPGIGTEFLDPPGDENRSFDTSSYAELINDRGDIVGTSRDESENLSVFLRHSDGTFLEFGSLGYEWLYPDGLNNNGQVILNGGNTYASWTTCTSLDLVGGYNAFLYDPDDGLIDLNATLGGSCVHATGINDLGEIIGVVDNKPFVYSAADGFFDLTPLLVLGAYQYISPPVAINNRGQILVNSGGSPIILTRVSEPETLFMLMAGLGMLAFAGRKRTKCQQTHLLPTS